MKCLRWIPSASFIMLVACAPRPLSPPATPPPSPLAPSTGPSLAVDNPFFHDSVLPFHLPPFDMIKDAHYAPAFAEGMAAQRREIDAIARGAGKLRSGAERSVQNVTARGPARPTMENTVVALERSGRVLERVSKVFFNLNAANTNDTMQRVESDVAPKLAAHRDAILLDPLLFARVDAVYRQRDKLGLDPESAQLLERYETMFVRAGARLSAADKATLKQINQELSTLTTRFRQLVLKGAKAGAVVLDDVKQLDGLSPEQIGAAAEAATARGAGEPRSGAERSAQNVTARGAGEPRSGAEQSAQDVTARGAGEPRSGAERSAQDVTPRKLAGKWVIALENTTIQPVLGQLKSRALRERVFRASVARGNGGDHDTTALVAQIVKLRVKKAALLGYPNYAALSLAEETAGTPKAVNAILRQLAPAALAKAKAEALDIQRRIDAEARAGRTRRIELQPWDWAYYAEQARKASFDFTDAQVKPYFEMNRVLQDGVFHTAHALYGISFVERKDLPVYHPDVRLFEVREADGSVLGLLLLDYYKRDNKQGGAWMDAVVEQSTLLDRKPVVTNCLNISKPAAGEPALLTFDEVTTMFHEFGHGLHGLFSAVKYPLLSGINVPPDFGELPSQFNEMWARERVVLAHFARHHKTGAPMPKALLDKVLRAQTYGQGYATLEYLEAAMLDQSWHQVTGDRVPLAGQVMSFEAQALSENHVAYPPVPPRYHTTYFSHIFAGDGYAAAYYAYIWSEVLARDVGAWFHAHGGLTRAGGDVFRAKILSRGRTREPSALFHDFYGRAPDIKPLLEYRGLTLPKSARK